MRSRKKKLLLNTSSSFIFQICTIICGLILPRLILNSFGSKINGLVNSITQFLSIITFLELGVGSVVQSSLYEPLANHNDDEISKIIKSAENFFLKLAIILLVYVVLLIIFYPYIKRDFGHIFTAMLIIAISISLFAQYYFGMVDRLLLTADQRGYVQYTIQTITLILNTIVCAFWINLGGTIHIIKLTTSCIYLLGVLALRIYVNSHYNINRRVKYIEEPIKQKWNGIAQHVASVILDQTDIIVLTFFSTLANVSIYSVYHLVIYGVKNLFLSLTNGVQSLMGEYLARNEKEKLCQLFEQTEWILHTGTIFIFGCTTMLIVPFVSVYTKGITDVNYNVPLFAVLLTMANAGHCLRLPYNILILASGHYKQTQSNYIIAAIMNIVVSILMVKKWGLIGIAIGTLSAMFYQTLWMAIYDSKNILKRSLNHFYKHVFVDFLMAILGTLLSFRIPMLNIDFISWILLAITDLIIWCVVVIGINIIFYKEKLKELKISLVVKIRKIK